MFTFESDMSKKRSQSSSFGENHGDHNSRDHQLLWTMDSLNYGKQPARSPTAPLDSAAKLRLLLGKRQSSVKQLKDGGGTNDFDAEETLGMDDLATLLNDSYNLTSHLEEQVQYYQDTVKMLRQRSEHVVMENEILYEKLKENLVSDALNGKEMKEPIPNKTQDNKSRVSLKDEQEKLKKDKVIYSKEPLDDMRTSINQNGFTFQDRQYFHQLEQEMDKVKKLNQEKTRRLEDILQTTRDELQAYRDQALKLQSRLRTYEAENGQRHDSVCVECRRKDGVFTIPPSEAHTKTLSQLTRERDELMETLVKQKSLLTQCQQREFEAYTQVKKSVETVEQAQLEKAEAMIKIQQLRSGLEEERKRQENVLVKNQEKTKQEMADMKEIYERKHTELNVKLQEQTQKCDITENQLDKLSREKVNLIAELEKAKAELMTSKLDIAQVSQDTKGEVVKITRQCVKAQQDVDNLQNIQARQLREHEQEKASLTTENEELRRRLGEAQHGWVESREECIRTLDKLKKLESDLHLATASKTNLEKARQESAEFFKKQEKEREKHFLEILEAKEKEQVSLRKELEDMLEAQMQVTQMVKEESKKLTQKFEDKAKKYRLNKEEWREQHSQLTTKVQTLLKQHEGISKKNQEDSKTNKKLNNKVEFLKNEHKKAMKTIYELLKKQSELMQDRQSLSREIEYLRSHGAVTMKQSSGARNMQEMSLEVSAKERERYDDDDDTLSNDKPISENERDANALDGSL